MDRLTGKTCFVTGAAQGIGRSIADLFLAEGAMVVAADLRFHDVVQHENLTRLVLDVCDPALVSAAAAEHEAVSVLVNCVGWVANGTVLDCSLDTFDRSMSINVRSMMITISAFLPAMLARQTGSIVNIASVVSSLKSAPNRFAYATTKAAVIGLTMSVARDFIDQGIRCNAISPGTVETPSLEDRIRASGDQEAARRAFVARQPLGRLARPDEVAATAVLLASDEASYMTGTNIIVDGGWSL